MFVACCSTRPTPQHILEHLERELYLTVTVDEACAAALCEQYVG
jgi:hypothetical protein